jgi:hypothetical protein
MPKETEDKRQERAREGAQAWADYQADARATREKTARLRALRLARDAMPSKIPESKILEGKIPQGKVPKGKVPQGKSKKKIRAFSNSQS